MTKEQKDAILALARNSERLWVENAALKVMFEISRMGTAEEAVAQATNWQANLAELLASEDRQLATARFEDLLRAIEQAREDQEILEMLSKLPTQGLPN